MYCGVVSVCHAVVSVCLSGMRNRLGRGVVSVYCRAVLCFRVVAKSSNLSRCKITDTGRQQSDCFCRVPVIKYFTFCKLA